MDNNFIVWKNKRRDFAFCISMCDPRQCVFVSTGEFLCGSPDGGITDGSGSSTCVGLVDGEDPHLSQQQRKAQYAHYLEATRPRGGCRRSRLGTNGTANGTANGTNTNGTTNENDAVVVNGLAPLGGPVWSSERTSLRGARYPQQPTTL